MAFIARGAAYTAITLSAGAAYFYVTDTRASIHQYIIPPLLRLMYPDAEPAHEKGTKALKALHATGFGPRERSGSGLDDGLGTSVFGQRLSNPLGTSAGMDKNAEVPDALLALGAAVVEIGGVTPRPQVGNPKPRVFRIPSQNALINRYGLNSDGVDAVAMRLRRRVRDYAWRHGFGCGEAAEETVLNGGAGVPPGSLVEGKLLAVQVAKNKATPDGDLEAVTSDYVTCVEKVSRYADIITVNVSSPNTPGLRALQNVGPLTQILTGVVQAAKSTRRRTKPAVMVKVSPDENSDEQVAGICEVVRRCGVDGIIVGNTTTKRPDALPKGYVMPPEEAAVMSEQGGYSGPQLFEGTLALVKKYRTELDKSSGGMFGGDRKVIFASGGITNGRQAKEVLEAGASVAMVYTALVYGGVGTLGRMKQEMKIA